MGGERASTTRMRERGQICCICLRPLAPPHPWRERRCTKCDHSHRVYLHTHCVKQFWVVQYLEADLKTPLGRIFHYADLSLVRNILVRANADAEAWEEFESGIRRWGIGSCYLKLTPEQYKKLKASRNALVPRREHNG